MKRIVVQWGMDKMDKLEQAALESRRKADEANAELDFIVRFVYVPFMACIALYALVQGFR